ncbi:MAG TPA: FAD-binding oxidoreductase [Ignavibacteria bacterium]|nr:FAD-binding oxidoreductase [Ignavibacteria bacterium]HMQ98614.1 FAD-binding oxidoreductase [Ignavibacteria bacterium]
MLSFWEKNSFLEYDIIIVGSGILGLSTACEIKERYPAKNIIVLERGILPTGASTKNAGFLCFGSLTEILADFKLKGEAETLSLVEKRWKGINYLKERLSENKIGYHSYGGYDLIDTPRSSAIREMDRVNALLRQVFDKDVFEVSDGRIKEFGFSSELVSHLVYSPFEAQIDTGEMMKTLIKYAQFLGVQITNGAGAKEISGGKVSVWHSALNEQVTFRSEKVIVCANAFVNRILPEPEVKPGRGQVLITNEIEELKFKGIFHYDEGYYYFRNYGNRVIIGGGRNLDFSGEESFEFSYNEKIIDDLKNKLDNMILPGLKYEITDKWTGIMGFTENKLPEVKVIDGNTIAALSCNGMGIALSSYIAREIVDHL